MVLQTNLNEDDDRWRVELSGIACIHGTNISEDQRAINGEIPTTDETGIPK